MGRQGADAEPFLDCHYQIWPVCRPGQPAVATVLKLCLQLLVCLTIVLRLVMLFAPLWRQERRSLAAEFRQELRRRGLLAPLPRISP